MTLKDKQKSDIVRLTEENSKLKKEVRELKEELQKIKIESLKENFRKELKELSTVGNILTDIYKNK